MGRTVSFRYGLRKGEVVIRLRDFIGIRFLSKEERASYYREHFPEQKGFNDYFNAMGIVYRVAEFLFLFLFLGFLAVSAMRNLSGITYSNAEYLFRNFSITLESNKIASTELVYNPDTEMQFATGGKGFSVCGNTGVSLFSATGRNTCNEAMALRNPCIRAAGKYTLVFESNGTSYAVFGPYSLVYSGKTEYPIRGASLAENGTYALLSGAEGYTSAVTVYDSDFSPVNRYLKNAYVISAELDASGEHLVIAALDTDADGSFVSEISEYTVGTEETDRKTTGKGSFVLRALLSGDCLYTVYADRLDCRKGGETRSLSFDGCTVEDFRTSEGACVVLLSGKKAGGGVFYRLVQFDADGSARDSGQFSAQYCRMAMCGNRTFLLTDAGLRVFENANLGEALPLSRPYSEDTVILAYSREKIYLAGKSAAYLIEVS